MTKRLPHPPIDNFVEVTIESLAGLGDGVTTHHGKPLFVTKSCVQDQLRVHISQETKEAYYGTITHILQAGPERRDAPCPHFNECGGCSLQQLTETAYQHYKQQLMQQSLQRAGLSFDTAPIEFLSAATRRRVEFKINHHNGVPTLAFHQPRSHKLISIERCLILEPSLQALIAPVNAALATLSFVKHITAISLTATDSGIDLVITLLGDAPNAQTELEQWCKSLGIARLSLRDGQGKLTVIHTITPVTMTLGGYAVPLPPDAFLQASVAGQLALTHHACSAAAHAQSVIDLFCGIGTYSFPLSTTTRVHAAEGDSAMIGSIRNAISRHAITTMTAEKRDLFNDPVPIKQLNAFNAAIINPPRAGAKAQCEKLAQSTISTVVMISCNPATFSRDARLLCEGGYHMTSIIGVDQFVWSEHLELAATFSR